MTHTGEKPHKCTMCDLAFIQRYNLKNHMMTHTGERPFKCNTCGQGFIQRTHYKWHVMKHTGEKPYQCPHCDKAYRTRQRLDFHLVQHTGETPFHCDLCERSFATKTGLVYHTRTHSADKPYVCTVCAKGFLSKGNLKIHMRRHSNGKRGSKLLVHVGSRKKKTQPNSTEDPPAVCDDEDELPSVERSHQCQLCGKEFARQSRLEVHRRKHTGEKPHACALCGARFRRMRQLKKHLTEVPDCSEDWIKEMCSIAEALEKNADQSFPEPMLRRWEAASPSKIELTRTDISPRALDSLLQRGAFSFQDLRS